MNDQRNEADMEGQGDHDQSSSPSHAVSPFSDGATAGVGSLPHRDAAAAAAFAVGEFSIASIPWLPNLGAGASASTPLAQAVSGLPGVMMTSEGLSADGAPSPDAALNADLSDPSFAGLAAFLDLAGKIRLNGTPVTWGSIGPVTLGVALHNAGLDTATAFGLAVKVVRTQLADVAAAVTAVLPNSAQLVMLDEPALADLMAPDFPIPPDQAIDMMSSGMAAISSHATVGIHSDRPCDIATMLASGPGVISVPVGDELLDWAGYLNRFLDDGGVISWGAVPTEGPISPNADRHWRALSDLWCALVQQGCGPVALRRQGIVTPGGGLGAHSVSVARRIARMTAEVGKRVTDQANATRFALGA